MARPSDEGDGAGKLAEEGDGFGSKPEGDGMIPLKDGGDVSCWKLIPPGDG